MNSTDEGYWTDYNSLQRAKHQLLTSYLNAWFPILAKWNGRVLYIDSHAGRGRHETGHPGSPILALKLLLGHSARNRILAQTECRFIFFENNAENFKSLKEEINSLGDLPDGVGVESYDKDYEAVLVHQIEQLRQKHQLLAPTFAFIDPYGFTLPVKLLNELLAFQRCELLINFMFRYVDMAVMGDADNSQNLGKLFGSDAWINLRSILNHDTRAQTTIDLFSRQLNARHVTHMQMRGKNGALKYVLIHATNNEKGRSKFKEAIWAVTPDGTFTASERHSPNQMVLVTPKPDLEPLKRELQQKFAGNPIRMQQLYKWLVDTMYLDKHLHQAIRELHKANLANYSGYQGKFSFGQNPLIEIKHPN